ncbi:MAG: MarR family transcriptional regulator [Candidatus Micrarchaeota archaeon]
MENRTVALVILGFAILLGFVVWSYDNALNDIVSESCTHGTTCPMYGTLTTQRNISIGLIGLLLVMGAALFLLSESKQQEARAEPAARKLSVPPKSLKGDERAVYDALAAAGGSLYQGDVARKTDLGKVRVSRVLDKLEHDGLVERKRRGMANLVVLK